jgi:hypothetical protein
MTRDTGNTVDLIVFYQAFPFFKGRNLITAAGDSMGDRGMAANTGKIATIRGHVHIQFPAGLEQRRIQISMLDPVSTAAVKVASPAVGSAG